MEFSYRLFIACIYPVFYLNHPHTEPTFGGIGKNV